MRDISETNTDEIIAPHLTARRLIADLPTTSSIDLPYPSVLLSTIMPRPSGLIQDRRSESPSPEPDPRPKRSGAPSPEPQPRQPTLWEIMNSPVPPMPPAPTIGPDTETIWWMVRLDLPPPAKSSWPAERIEQRRRIEVINTFAPDLSVPSMMEEPFEALHSLSQAKLSKHHKIPQRHRVPRKFDS